MNRVRATVVTVRIVAMILSLWSISWLYQCTVAADLAPLTVFRTVYVQCILIVVTLLYYIVLRLCHFGLCLTRGGTPRRTRRASDGSPLPSTDGIVRPIMSVSGARLTIRNVWVFVFGLGSVFFITAYCLIGLHPVCLTFLGLAVSILAADELVCPSRDVPYHYTVSRTGALICAAAGLFMLAPPVVQSAISSFIVDVDIYAALFGVAFPFLAQLTLSVVRDRRAYTWRSVLEACEFGFPFTGFLGVFHLCVAYGQRQQVDSDALSAFAVFPSTNHTTTPVSGYLDFRYWYHFNDSAVYDLIDTNQKFLTFYTLTPLVFVPVCVCFMWCVLDGCAIDSLLAVTVTLALEHSTLTTGFPSGWDVAASVLCGIGLCIRFASEYRPLLTGGHPQIYSMQGDSTQLPYFIAWARGNTERGPTMQECEAETQELASDFPSSHARLTLA